MSAHTACAAVTLSSRPESRLLQVWQAALQALRPQWQSWQVQPGQALSLRVRHAAVLQLQSGTAWVTQRGAMPTAGDAADSASTDSGDVFLNAGQCLAVRAGQHLVLEHAGAGPTASQGLVAGVLVRAASGV